MTDNQLSLDEILKLADSANEWERHSDGGGPERGNPPYLFCIPKEGFKIKLSQSEYHVLNDNAYILSISCTFNGIEIGLYKGVYRNNSVTILQGDGRIRELNAKAWQNYGARKQKEEEEIRRPIREKAEKERIDAVKKARGLIK